MRIFFDVDTQNDFMNSDGALYVPGAEEIKPNLKLLTKHAFGNSIRIFGSLDKHFGTREYKDREGELQRWGGPFPDHCMAGTHGFWKILETCPPVKSHHEFPGENVVRIPHWPPAREDKQSLRCPENLVETNDQIYFEKQTYDVFSNPTTEEVLQKAKVNEAVVYGVATDYCVKAAVLGMQEKGIQTYVVEDAIMGIDSETTKSALEEMARAGAKFVTTKEILEERI